MADQVLLLVGSIVIGILVFTLAFRFLTVSIKQAQYQIALNEFNRFYSNIQSVCMQEIGNRMRVKYQIPDSVRVVYFSYDDKNAVPAVTDLITNQELSEGNYLCLQFKKEQEVRCQQINCVGYMPYIGALEEYNDLQLAVNKILGRPMVKEYIFQIEKNFNGLVEINFS